MSNFSSPYIGLLRVIDAVQTSPTQISSLTDPQKLIEFPQVDFSKVSTEKLLEAAIAALHPDKTSSSSSETTTGKWIVQPSLCAAATNDDENNNNFGGEGGSILPMRASLLACGLSPEASGGASCEVYLIGQYHHHQQENNIKASSANNRSNFDYHDENNDSSSSSIHHQGSQAFFAPTKVMVTFWCVRDRPSYEIDLRRPLSEVTLSKFKKVLEKFSGISSDEMLVEVDGLIVAATANHHDESKRKVFPFVFDPSIIPNVRIRSKKDNNDIENEQQHLFSPTTSQTTANSIRAAHIPRIEAEYGQSYFSSPLLMKKANNNNSSSENNTAMMGKLSSEIIPIEKSRDWDAWLAARKQAREVHVRHLLAPSSREQLEVERALQVQTLEDVKNVTKNASNELASSSQILHQQLETVRAEILRERLGDATFAKSEGERGLLNGPVKTCVSTDGLSREPMVVDFR